MTRKLQIAGLALLLALAAVALFAPTFDFVNLRLDDWGYTAGCPFVKDGLSWANVKGALCDPANGAIWMPLTYVTYMLDISLFGSGWGPHHAVNVALHAVNAMLVFFLLLRLLPKFGCERPASAAAGAFLAALVWLVHPMRVEPVAWIAARKELLWSLFAFSGLMAWLGFLERGRWREWTLTFIFFLAACLSKPTALCFPLLAFALHRFAAPDGKARFRSYGAFLAVSVVIGALTVFSQMNPTGQAKIDIYDTTLGWRCLNALVSLGLYLWHAVVPTGVHFDYRAVFEGWPLEGTLGLAVVAVVAVALAAFFLRTKDAFARRAAALTVWGFLLPLVPALGVFGIVGDHAYADRYAYLPSVALAFAAGVLLARAAGRKGGAWLSAAVGVLLAAGEVAVAVPMVGTFRNDVTVFSRVLEKDPDHWRALEYIGSEYCARLGRMEEGVAMLRRSYRLSPRPSSAATLAYVLALRGAPGDFAEVRRLGAKVAANPKLDRGGMMLDALGIVAMREADDKAAVRCFSAALVAPKRGHSNVHSLLNLGLCLANTGKDRDALAVLSKLSAVRDEAIRRRAAEAIRAVKSNEPYARFEWKSDARSEAVPAANREETLTRGWRFSRVEAPEARFAAVAFDDSKWTEVEVPHDWAIAGPFGGESKDGATGQLPWKGVGVYRRTFELSERDLQGCVLLDFDGVMTRPQVYVNGRLAGGWDYGYMSFRVDATKFAKPGPNQLTVVADTRAHRSRWYPGAGMTRKVVLKTRPKAHFVHNGIFVTTPVVEPKRAVVKVAWEVENADEEATVEVSVGAAREGAGATARRVRASAKSVEFELAEPMLWDVTNPVLYRATCTLNGGARESVRFGVRKIAFPVAKDRNAREGNGFYLNGRRVELKGVNLHEDCGILGRAYSRFARRRQLLQMKDMGANALRTSHYPVAPETLDLCDELGILVWDECFDKWDDTASRLADEPLEPYVARNLRAFIRRDRNHPSVIVWSMGNEIGGFAAKKDGFTSDPAGMTRERCSFFRGEMLKEDATRPIGNGNMPHMAKPKFFERHLWDDLDILGFNYLASHDTAKAVYPDKPIVYSEFASPGSTYGYYCAEPSKTRYSWRTGEEFAAKQMDGYDLGTTIDLVDWEFERLERAPYCAGGFVWTGIDYLGEPIPYTDFARSSYFGNVDLTGAAKDRFYLFRSYWNPDATTIRILPHWNWPGREGRKVPVFVYTNGDAAELFVNGKSQGVRRKGACDLPDGRTNDWYRVCGKYRLMWFDTVYEPGEVKAVAYRRGEKLGESVMRTAGRPASLRLTPERTDLPNDGETLAYVQVEAVDAEGRGNPLATNRVSFAISGPGRILAVGNGNPRGMDSFKDVSGHPLFFGKATAIVRREGEGRIVLTATADGLRPAHVRFE